MEGVTMDDMGTRDTGGPEGLVSTAEVGPAERTGAGSKLDPATGVMEEAPTESDLGAELGSPGALEASALAAASAFVGRPRFFFGGCSIGEA
jgi:hypothetical protein